MWSGLTFNGIRATNDRDNRTVRRMDVEFLFAKKIVAGDIAGNVFQFNDDDSAVILDTSDYTASDFVFGAPGMNLADAGANTKRMLFDVSNGAFRVGEATDTSWDARGTGSFASGTNNGAYASNSFIGGGAGHSIEGGSPGAGIVGGGTGIEGSHVIVFSEDAFIGGGAGHSITGLSCGFSVGGCNNVISRCANGGIAGGTRNGIYGPIGGGGSSVILGGTTNAIGQSAPIDEVVAFDGDATNCAAVAGSENVITGDEANGYIAAQCTIAGGTRNAIGADSTTSWPPSGVTSGPVTSSFVAAGTRNSVVFNGVGIANCFIGAGRGNLVARSNAAILCGTDNTVESPNSCVLAGENQTCSREATAHTANLTVTGAVFTEGITESAVPVIVVTTDTHVVIADVGVVDITLPSANAANVGWMGYVKLISGAGPVTLQCSGGNMRTNTGIAASITLDTANPGDVWAVQVVISSVGLCDVLAQTLV
jgi:hypothetical protein